MLGVDRFLRVAVGEDRCGRRVLLHRVCESDGPFVLGGEDGRDAVGVGLLLRFAGVLRSPRVEVEDAIPGALAEDEFVGDVPEVVRILVHRVVLLPSVAGRAVEENLGAADGQAATVAVVVALGHVVDSAGVLDHQSSLFSSM